MMSGLDIRYDFGDGHPLLGRRMPDLDLITADGPQRVFTLLHDARPLLLNFGEPGSLDFARWEDRVRPIDAQYIGPWELPVLGNVMAPGAVVVRPDGHVAWVGEGNRIGLARLVVRTTSRGITTIRLAFLYQAVNTLGLKILRSETRGENRFRFNFIDRSHR